MESDEDKYAKRLHAVYRELQDETIFRFEDAAGRFNLVFEKGEAAKSIFEMSAEEIRNVGQIVFDIAKSRAHEIGEEPIIRTSK